jgi:hypothetical protein
MITEGRARGDYLGRSYTIPDSRVERVCDLSTRLFLNRCWATGSLMERCIGLDHLAAVMRRFYSGRRVEDLAERILSWRLEVNRDTLSLLDELFEVGRHGTDEPALARLKRREEASRHDLFKQGLDLFDELNELTLSMVGLERRETSLVETESRPLARLARHAAAALLAIGVASWCSCDDDVSVPADARVEIGQAEYAPPPVDGGVEIGQAEFAPPPVDAHVEIGQAEFAPPPVDGGAARVEFGHAEYAPPPVDGGKKDKK